MEDDGDGDDDDDDDAKGDDVLVGDARGDARGDDGDDDDPMIWLVFTSRSVGVMEWLPFVQDNNSKGQWVIGETIR